MVRQDWLVGTDRRAEAVERIHTAAAELISRHGFEAFSIDALAAKVHCSPATIYRNVGGKSVIMEGVVRRMSVRIVERVKTAIDGLEGAERVEKAILVALDHIRAEPLGPLIMGTIRPHHDTGWLTSSPLVVALAEEMIGRSDPIAAQWLLRATLALWYWPVKNRDDEHAIVARFIGPCFAAAE
ncbi:TetR/AcrR family transcriptional regulator [Mycobacterium sp. ZZG]